MAKVAKEYTCKRCYKMFKQKSHFQDHLKRKNPCEDNMCRMEETLRKNNSEITESITERRIKSILDGKMGEENLETFPELYLFLQGYEKKDLTEFITNTNWTGKDPMESILRIFACLGLISKLEKYNMCIGSYNEGTLSLMKNKYDFFYRDGKPSKLKDKGDSSDLTVQCDNGNTIVAISCKNNSKKVNLQKLDIEKMAFHKGKYEKHGKTVKYGLCVRSIEKLRTAIRNANLSSENLVKTFHDECVVLIDINDLNEAYYQFKRSYSSYKFSELVELNKNPLVCFPHQLYAIDRVMEIMTSGELSAMLCHIQRSGKTYVVTGCIVRDSLEREKCNYLIMTTAPKETIRQFKVALNCSELKDFNVVHVDGNNKKPHLGLKNIIICSKQFFDSKDKDSQKDASINWIRAMTFRMTFIDESHNGGGTEIAKKTLDIYAKKSFRLYMSATYFKPVFQHSIPREHWITWDLEDIKLCKTIKTKGHSMDRLVEKYGEKMREIMLEFSLSGIREKYSKYPDFHILTPKLTDELILDLVDRIDDSGYGYSLKSVLALNEKTKKFKSDKGVLNLLYSIFGKCDEYNVHDKKYPPETVYMNRVDKICEDNGSRRMVNGANPIIVMAFLPSVGIDDTSNALMDLIGKCSVLPDYVVASINSKKGDPIKVINDAHKKAVDTEKKGVLILSGQQCRLGVSLEHCDVVLLLNESKNFDDINQKMFRGMTNATGKTCGFVIDLDIRRIVETVLVPYALAIKPNGTHPKEAVEYMLRQQLVNLNCDHLPLANGKHLSAIKTMAEKIYKIYGSKISNTLGYFLHSLGSKNYEIPEHYQTFLNKIFNGLSESDEKIRLMENLANNEGVEELGTGIEKVTDELDKGDDTNDDGKKKEEKKEEKLPKINYTEILKHMIPLVCVLTIRSKETSLAEMCKVINQNETLNNILIEQTQSWWGKQIDGQIIQKLLDIYVNCTKGDEETNQIIRTIKELFIENINDCQKMSELIDKYLIPHSIEKKNNAEVSTPAHLRKEMLDKVPNIIWESGKKVFEPCVGKGGFLVDIVDRFMKGLKSKYPDETQRRKIIIEKCIYFCDINPTNIFISKLLLDPFNQYKLHYHCGNTLELDIKEKWNIDGFKLIVSNPPYNASNTLRTGNTIWQKFTKKSLDDWLKPNGFLLSVHPPGWRKPNSANGTFSGMYDLMVKENNMRCLSIHGMKDGLDTFKCGTRYDWYMIKKQLSTKSTTVRDEDGNLTKLNLQTLSWLPNKNIKNVCQLIASDDDEKCPLIFSRSAYGADNHKRMSVKKTETHKYPCVHSTTKTEGVKYRYSNVNDKGHFGVKKVIFGETGAYTPVLDLKGEYGMTHGAMAIQITSKKEGEKIIHALKSPEFRAIMDSCLFSTHRWDWNVFACFKKNFWENFQ